MTDDDLQVVRNVLDSLDKDYTDDEVRELVDNLTEDELHDDARIMETFAELFPYRFTNASSDQD